MFFQYPGPQIWPQKFTIATAGKRQSPIDIITADSVLKTGGHHELKIEYPSSFPSLSVVNTGHGWKVDIPEELALKTCMAFPLYTEKCIDFLSLKPWLVAPFSISTVWHNFTAIGAETVVLAPSTPSTAKAMQQRSVPFLWKLF